MGCNMSLKIHFLRFHLDFFPPWKVNMAKVPIRILAKFKRDTVEKGVKYFVLLMLEFYKGDRNWRISVAKEDEVGVWLIFF